jgi:hypothetical protein
VSCQPADQWTRTVELGANACVGGRRVEPGLERVTAIDRDLLHAQPLDARVVDWIAARRPLQLGRRQFEARGPRHPDSPLERPGPAAIGDGGAIAVELVGRRSVRVGGHEQPVKGCST